MSKYFLSFINVRRQKLSWDYKNVHLPANVKKAIYHIRFGGDLLEKS